MSNYTKSTNFATKDNLTPGDPLKVVRGTEIDTEYNNIATAIATKTDNASAAITGGSITGITDLAIADGGTGASTAAGALNNLLPSQTSAANKYLQSDGTNASWDAVTLSTADITGTLPVANGGTGVTASTGTGSVVLSNSPTLVTPALGTPASGTATNLTGLPISTGVSGLGTGVATFLGTPSSANLASAVSDETGSGALVFATSPTLVTPALGTPSALVGTNITGTASGLTAGNVTTNANLTGAVTSVGNATSLGSFTSANLLGALTDETGTGSAVFATSPTLVTPILGTPTSATLTNATGLPIATGVSGLGTGVATFLATPSSANLAAALTDETGTGSAVFATSPTLVTPVLGTPTSATLTNATGLPLTTGVTGVLPTANGGTNLGGATPFTSGGVVYASSTSALATGSALVFDGATTRLMVNASTNGGIGSFYVGNPSASSEYMNIVTSTSGTGALLFGNTTAATAGRYAGAITYSHTANSLTFDTASTNRMVIDGSGNLGLGVTPSAWENGRRVFQMSSLAYIMGSGTSLTNAVNAYYNGTNWIYNSNGAGALYDISAGVHAWSTAASGTAGNTVSFTQAMTLDASGNLGVGLTSPTAARLVVQGVSGNYALRVNDRNGNPALRVDEYGAVYVEQDLLVIKNTITTPSNGTAMLFSQGASEKARIDTSGNLLVGATASGQPDANYFMARDASGFQANIGHLTGTASGQPYVYMVYGGVAIGSITQNGTTGVLYNLTSDYRLKNNIVALTGAKDFVMALQPKKWQWWDGSGEGVGFVAHEFMEVAKYSGTGVKDAVDKEGKPVMQSIQPSSSEVMANIVSLIQEQQALIVSLKARLDAANL